MMRLYIVMGRYQSPAWSPSYSGAREAQGSEVIAMEDWSGARHEGSVGLGAWS